MCKATVNTKPYELTFMSFVCGEDKTLQVCRRCAYKEAYGTKGMGKAMKEKEIEEETN